MKIKKASPPQTVLLQSALPAVDYADAFTCEFIIGDYLSVDDFVKRFFTASPKWVENLLILRNRIVRLVGLKVPDPSEKEAETAAFKVEKGSQLALFRVFDRSENEVILGEDDSHLNFRISFLLEEQHKGTQEPGFPVIENYEKDLRTEETVFDLQDTLKHTFTLTTVVTINNMLGRLYFLPVKQFHKIIVPAMMKAIIEKLKEEGKVKEVQHT